MQIRETRPVLSFLSKHDISIDTLLEILQEQEAPALARAPNDLGYIVNYRHHPLTEAIFPQYLCADNVPVTGDVAFFSINISTLEKVLRTKQSLVVAANHLVFPSQGALEICSAETFLDTRHPTLTRTPHVEFRFVHSWSNVTTNTAHFGPRSAPYPTDTTPDLSIAYRPYSVTVTPDLLHVPSTVIDSILTYISADSNEPTIEDPFAQLEWMSEPLKTLNRISKKYENELSNAKSGQASNIKEKLRTELRQEFSRTSDTKLIYFAILLLPEGLRDPRLSTPIFDTDQQYTDIPQPSTLLQFTNWYAFTSYETWKEKKDPSVVQSKTIEPTLQNYGASARLAAAMARLLNR